MSAVTIPKEMHERMVETFRCEYAAEFGDMGRERTFTRAAMIAKYASDIAFWKAREPVIDLAASPSLRAICAHAITTNAQSCMWRLCDEKNIRIEVEQALRERSYEEN